MFLLYDNAIRTKNDLNFNKIAIKICQSYYFLEIIHDPKLHKRIIKYATYSMKPPSIFPTDINIIN